MGLWANSGHDTGRHKSSWGFKCQSVQMPCFPKSAVAWVLTVNQTHTVDFILILHFFFNFTKRWREECWVHSESDSEVTQSCPTLCDPVDCNLPGSSVHGILQTRVLEWVAIAFSNLYTYYPVNSWSTWTILMQFCLLPVPISTFPSSTTSWI